MLNDGGQLPVKAVRNQIRNFSFISIHFHRFAPSDLLKHLF